jgi:hypothetical protein
LKLAVVVVDKVEGDLTWGSLSLPADTNGHFTWQDHTACRLCDLGAYPWWPTGDKGLW